MSYTSIPSIDVASFHRLGSGIERPEGVCAAPDGAVWASDRTSLVARIDADGGIRRLGSGASAPNGLALDRRGRIVIAEFGLGALLRLDPATGLVDMVATEVDGRAIRTPNVPAIDVEGRIWCTNSTNRTDRRLSLGEDLDDGFVFVIDPDGGSRIVADGLHFANGCAFSPDRRWLYIAESATRTIVRAPVLPGGELGAPDRFGSELDATPDGLAFDRAGNLWVTLLIERNALVVVDLDGQAYTVAEDPEGTTMRAPSNLAFGGADGRDLYVASLELDHVLHARAPVPGLRLWMF